MVNVLAASFVLAVSIPQVPAEKVRDVPFVPTREAVVERMLEMAQLKAGDVVYDLGCGDGRIVIAAVRAPGVKGVCVEIDPALVQKGRDNAAQAGVADRIEFVHGDIFEVPIKDATVVTLYLLPDVNLRLRPRLLAELRPGTRVISNSFGMGDWKPDQTASVGEPPADTKVHLWTIPERTTPPGN